MNKLVTMNSGAVIWLKAMCTSLADQETVHNINDNN